MCFNSQRDGILPRAPKKACRDQGVSIPNGMEFYMGKLSRSCENLSFNSQRDGILPFACLTLGVLIWFQFPTGWNSTLAPITGELLSAVSIPNGMEFYSTTFLKLLPCLMFQFPTGWNSTLRLGTEFSAKMRFNSQRDGILHFLE